MKYKLDGGDYDKKCILKLCHQYLTKILKSLEFPE